VAEGNFTAEIFRGENSIKRIKSFMIIGLEGSPRVLKEPERVVPSLGFHRADGAKHIHKSGKRAKISYFLKILLYGLFNINVVEGL